VSTKSHVGIDLAKEKDYTVKVTVSVKKKIIFYPMFYILKTLYPLLIWLFGVEKTYNICEKLLRKTMEIKVI